MAPDSCLNEEELHRSIQPHETTQVVGGVTSTYGELHEVLDAHHDGSKHLPGGPTCPEPPRVGPFADPKKAQHQHVDSCLQRSTVPVPACHHKGPCTPSEFQVVQLLAHLGITAEQMPHCIWP